MNVLIVSQYFWPESFRINDLATGLVERGHQVTVLTGMPNYPQGKLFSGYSWWRKRHENFGGIPVYRVPLFLRRQGKGWQLLVNYLSFVLSGCLLGPFMLRRKKFDLIFVCQLSPVTAAIPALLLRQLKQAPIFLWVQDLWPESLHATGAMTSKWALTLVEKLVRFIYLRSDKILIQSRAFIEPVKRFGISENRIMYFPNSAEDLYRPVEADFETAAGDSMPDGFRVMFAGNIGAAQDFDTILKAAKLLADNPEIHWVILGTGRMSDWVAKEVQRHGLDAQVHMLGRFPVEEMPGYFAFADAFLASLKKQPIFSLTIPAKIQSYLACGRPIIASLDGEGARVVQEARAGLAPGAENPLALADAVLDLYHMSTEERAAMGERGRIYYEKHFERGLLLNRLDGWMKQAV